MPLSTPISTSVSAGTTRSARCRTSGSPPAAASTAADKVTPSGSSGSGGDHRSDLEDQLNPDSTALQDNPYPQGNLP